MSRLAIALFETARPHNLGAAVRLCACFDLELHLIEPLGFPLSDRRIRQTALDYGGFIELRRHLDAHNFFDWAAAGGRRVVLLDTRAAVAYHRVRYRSDDVLLLGNERYGVPAAFHQRAQLAVRIPLAPGRRSLNLVVAGAIVAAEAMRQLSTMDALSGPPLREEQRAE